MDMVSKTVVDRHGKQLKKGEIIFREGDLSDTMYFIQRGRVSLWADVDGEQVCLTILENGEFFGDLGEGVADRTVRAMADSDVVLVAIDSNTLNDLVVGEPRLAARMIDRLGRRLQAVDERLINSMRGDEAARMGKILLSLARRSSEKQGPGPLDRDSLARLAGVLPSAAEPIIERLVRSAVLNAGQDGGLNIVGLRDVEDFVDYCELKRRYDPLRLDELADLAGMALGEVEVLAERVIAKRLRLHERRGSEQVLKTPLQRYLQLKLRFEFSRERPSGRMEFEGSMERR